MNIKLKELVSIMPYIKEMSGQDAEINIWNTDGVDVGCFSSKSFEMPFEVGYTIENMEDPLFRVMKEGKKEYVNVPKEVFGHNIEGYLTPVMDGDEVVGCVSYVFSAERSKQMSERSEHLHELILESSGALNHICSVFTDITKRTKKLYDRSIMIDDEIKKVQSINVTIQKNAKYSNILALNASIESARVGSAGRGFAVVAEEMRTFSKTSSDSAKVIDTTLMSVNTSLNEIYKEIHETLDVTTTEHEEIEKLNRMLLEVEQMSNNIIELCKNFK